MGGYIGIEYKNLGEGLRRRVLGGPNQADRLLLNQGEVAYAVLDVAANIAEAETVSIGADVYEFDVVNTDSAKNTANGEWNNTADPIYVTMVAHGRAAGDLLRVENEIGKILRVIDVDHVVVARARCGTTAAAHADGLDIFQSATPPAANIPVGVVAVLTPAVAIASLVGEINNALAGDERATAKASTIYGTVLATALTGQMVVQGLTPGVLVLATTETMAGVGNAWETPTMVGGLEAAIKNQFTTTRVPTAGEVAAGVIFVALPFEASAETFLNIIVRVTATGVVKAWDGGYTLNDAVLQIDNAGAVDWAVTDTLYIQVVSA